MLAFNILCYVIEPFVTLPPAMMCTQGPVKWYVIHDGTMAWKFHGFLHYWSFVMCFICSYTNKVASDVRGHGAHLTSLQWTQRYSYMQVIWNVNEYCNVTNDTTDVTWNDIVLGNVTQFNVERCIECIYMYIEYGNHFVFIKKGKHGCPKPGYCGIYLINCELTPNERLN